MFQALRLRRAESELLKTFAIALLLAAFFRSFLFEPFHIPSGSMKDGLLVGDYLFVSKYSYGYSRYSFPFGLPLFKGRIFEHGPERGDVVVFRLPRDPKIDYIKRVIGLPGDRIQVKDGVLYINNKAVPKKPDGTFLDDEIPEAAKSIARYKETLPEGKEYDVLDETRFGDVDNTSVYTVPEAHYFMMGDNRDNSVDSRFLEHVGYVPAENIVGHAQIIFFSTDGSAKLWEVWKWIPSLRGNRFFHLIR